MGAISAIILCLESGAIILFLRGGEFGLCHFNTFLQRIDQFLEIQQLLGLKTDLTFHFINDAIYKSIHDPDDEGTIIISLALGGENGENAFRQSCLARQDFQSLANLNNDSSKRKSLNNYYDLPQKLRPEYSAPVQVFIWRSAADFFRAGK